MNSPLFLGIDIGTSGARCAAITATGEIAAQAAAPLARFGDDPRAPSAWWQAVDETLRAVVAKVQAADIVALAVDGTSGTMLPVDAQGTPLAEPLMYNDPVPDTDLVARIAPLIAPQSAAHGPTSGLAKALYFQNNVKPFGVLHQADWIAGRLSGRFDRTDENNALKTGYDPVARAWPDWLAATGLDAALLPVVAAAGTPLGPLDAVMARRYGLGADVLVIAGTTDGCASFLATGASEAGDGVTALGSTLTLKLLSDRPVFSPAFGIYSHRIGDIWLAGGASNSGGKVLAHFFDAETIRRLSAGIDPDAATGLDFYPLLTPGERFPIADPALSPRLSPRPGSDTLFLQAMLEGIAEIEALGYRRLADLGAPRLKSLRSVGGGAANAAWSAMRQAANAVPFLPALSDEAAVGAARLALSGAKQAGSCP